MNEQELEAAAELIDFVKKYAEKYKPLFKEMKIFEIRLSPSAKEDFNYQVYLQIKIPS